MLQASKLKLLIDCLFLLLSVNSVAQRGLSNWGLGCNFFQNYQLLMVIKSIIVIKRTSK